MKRLAIIISTMGLFSFLNKSNHAKLKLEISDDSGFIGVVNNDLYAGFVEEDWEFDDVLKKFTEQTNKGHSAIWSTGEPNYMSVYVLDKASGAKPFREIQTIIQVTNDKLWLVNYTDLTMVAQFADSKIPSRENSDLEIPLQNGIYELRIKQMFDPEKYDWKSPPDPCFELIFNPIGEQENNTFKDVIWWQEDRK